jgi:hypothetical protein
MERYGWCLLKLEDITKGTNVDLPRCDVLWSQKIKFQKQDKRW